MNATFVNVITESKKASSAAANEWWIYPLLIGIAIISILVYLAKCKDKYSEARNPPQKLAINV